MKITIPSYSAGTFQEMSLQKHKHPYEDRGAASRVVSTYGAASSATIADDVAETHETEDNILYSDGTDFSTSGETRPNTLVMNYMIKF